jgi:5-methylcytosine-specific restriction endonuclease McrA
MADGHLNVCRACIAIASAVRYANNKDVILAANRERRKDPKRAQRDRDWHAAWRAANPERWKETQRRAHAKDRANGSPIAKRSSLARRAREVAARDGIVSLKAVLATYGMNCSICKRQIDDKRHLTYDHVIPLVRGGKHSDDNLRPAHRACNSWKAGRLPEELVGLTPPVQGEVDAWDERRAAASKQAKAAAMRAWWADPANADKIARRNARVSASSVGNRKGVGGGPKGRKVPDEERVRRAAAVRAAYAKWTPEQHAAHVAKCRAAKQGSAGNVTNLAKGWTTEVRAKAIAASADIRRGKPQSEESNMKRSESLKQAYAEGRHPGNGKNK